MVKVKRWRKDRDWPQKFEPVQVWGPSKDMAQCYYVECEDGCFVRAAAVVVTVSEQVAEEERQVRRRLRGKQPAPAWAAGGEVVGEAAPVVGVAGAAEAAPEAALAPEARIAKAMEERNGAVEAEMIIGVVATDLSTVDVKTAFLQAPNQRQKLLVVTPPKIFGQAGVTKEGERWLVLKALYGLNTSPKDWGCHRDKTMASFGWRVNDVDFKIHPLEGNLWAIREVESGATVGNIVVYVDDMLVAAKEGVMKGFMQRLQ